MRVYCSACAEKIKGEVYIVNRDIYCEDCFKDYVKRWVEDYPWVVADEMSIAHHHTGGSR